MAYLRNHNGTSTTSHTAPYVDRAASRLMSWQPDASASQCPLCTVRFGWLQRKHHCRSCGRIVCGSCSAFTRVLAAPITSPFDDAGAALRVCTTCAHPPVPLARSSSHHRQAATAATAAAIASSTAVTEVCPVCHVLADDGHIRQCLKKMPWTAVRTRMVTWTSEATPETDGLVVPGTDYDECCICMEPFEVGQRISRLECLCVYHNACITQWLSRGGVCPAHPPD